MLVVVVIDPRAPRGLPVAFRTKERCAGRDCATLPATGIGVQARQGAADVKNWEMAHLIPAMMAYAAADAHVAMDLLAAIVG